MRKTASLLTMLMLCCALAFAQTRVTGVVRDAQGNPVPYATVQEVGGKRTSTSADADGRFSISVAENARLTFSATGFTGTTVAASSASSVTISRQDVTEAQIVVTSLNQVRQSKDLGYSTAKVKATELTQSRPVNIQEGLIGKVSGLSVQITNNGVFSDNRMLLRGIRSLTGNNQPMLVVDGVPLSLSYMSSLNPNDVADVSILKGASSTAIYGPDGVNGAIVITTKRGVKGRPQISLSHTVQMQSVSYMPKLQTRFGSGSSIDRYGNGVYDPIENQGYGDEFDGSTRQIGRTYTPGDTLYETYTAKPNAKKKFWDKGITNQTDLSFSTGDFYLSFQNVDIHGVVPKDENHRMNLRLRAEKEYNRLKASFNVNVTRSKYDITSQPDRDHSPYWLLLNTPMEVDITRFKDWKNDKWSNPNQYFNDYYSNPYFIIDNYRTKGTSLDLLGNMELNYKVASFLNLTYRLGGSFTNAESKATRGFFTYSDLSKASGKSIAASGDLNASVADAAAISSRVNSEFFASFNKSVNDFKFEALVGQSYRESVSKSQSTSSGNLGQTTLANVVLRRGEPSVGISDSKTRLERFFGRVSANFRGWANIEGTASYDIDSRLVNPYQPIDYKNIGFFYPGVNASIVLSDAIPALKDNKVLSFAKIRGAISKTGNVNLGAYSMENTFGLGTFFPFGNVTGFSASQTLFQTSYLPEFVHNKEVGIELGFLKNRINLEATVYNQQNDNQVISAAFSATTGYPRSLLNAAAFTNKGYELDLKLTPLVKIRNVTVDFKVNYSHQDSKITKIVEGVTELNVGNANYAIVGQPAFIFKLTDYVRDSLGRVIVDANTGMPKMDATPKNFGRTLPEHMLGLTMNVNWKGLTLSAVADYRSGYEIYTGNFAYALDFSGVSYRSGQDARRAFVFPNSVYMDPSSHTLVPNTNVYTQSFGYNFWSQDINTGVQSNYIASGAFWKLREVSITYQLPTRLFKGSLGRVVKGGSIGLMGRNLVTWLPSSNQWTDPEFSNSNTSNGQGVTDLFNTPPTRTFGANLTVNF